MKDTSDTDYDTDIEFDVASLSEDDEHMAAFWGDVQSDSSSGTDVSRLEIKLFFFRFD